MNNLNDEGFWEWRNGCSFSTSEVPDDLLSWQEAVRRAKAIIEELTFELKEMERQRDTWAERASGYVELEIEKSNLLIDDIENQKKISDLQLELQHRDEAFSRQIAKYVEEQREKDKLTSLLESAKANPWQLFPIAQLRLLIFDMEQEGHGEHPMCNDARAALAELERRKNQ